MNCFSDDIYALHALGLSEGAEREELNSHLRWNCGTCAAEVTKAAKFWLLFATIAERLQPVGVCGPSPSLWDRILTEVTFNE